MDKLVLKGYLIDMHCHIYSDQIHPSNLQNFKKGNDLKLNDTVLSPNLLYFRDRLSIPYIYQVVKKDKVDMLEKGGRILSAGKFLAGLI